MYLVLDLIIILIEYEVDMNENPIEIDLNQTNDISVMLRPVVFLVLVIEQLSLIPPMNIDSDMDVDMDIF
ncbi:unnamed protein product [Cunninghamella echinulata]